MSHLDGALQHIEEAKEGPPLGTLADAWVPCQLLRFEAPIDTMNEEQLQHLVTNVPQASSNEPGTILRNLQIWRIKCISASKADQQRLRPTCEAIRAKARLLYLASNGQKMLKAQHNQQVSTQQQQQEASHGWGSLGVC
jgi:hypothetical protein